MKRRAFWPGLLLGLLVPGVIIAANVVLPHAFQTGGVIRADEMNANFAALRDAVNLGFSSGSRLKVVQVRSPDGARLPVLYQGMPVFWDSQLNITCSALYGAGRCVPAVVTGGVVFADQACTQAVCTFSAPYATDNLFRTVGGDAGTYAESTLYCMVSAGAGFPQSTWRTGSQQTGVTYYRGVYPDGGFSCFQNSSLTTYYPVTQPEPLTTFAPLNAVVE